MKLPKIALNVKLPISLLTVANKKLSALLVFGIFLSGLLASCDKKNTFEDIELSNLSQQQIAQYTKPSVVRIVEGCKGRVSFNSSNRDNISAYFSGSGFFVDSRGYALTNAHVTKITNEARRSTPQQVCLPILFNKFVSLLAARLSVSPAQLVNNKEALEQIANLTKFSQIEQVSRVITPKGKALSFDIKSFGAPIDTRKFEGKDAAVVKVNLTNAPIIKLVKDSKQIQTLDSVNVIGYPAAADLNQVESEATFTSGKISARRNLNDGSPIFQMDAQITGGNSGGPVINKKGEAIGIAVAAVRGSSISYLVPANILMEFVRQAGASNELPKVNKLYLEGLVLYGNEKYSEALQKFEAVKKLYPDHSDVDRLISQSQQKV